MNERLGLWTHTVYAWMFLGVVLVWCVSHQIFCKNTKYWLQVWIKAVDFKKLGFEKHISHSMRTKLIETNDTSEMGSHEVNEFHHTNFEKHVCSLQIKRFLW